VLTPGKFFSAVFKETSKSCNLEAPLEAFSAEAHLTLFNSTRINILEYISPLKHKTVKPKSEPWLISYIPLRQICKSAEQRWKKDKLQMSYEMLRVSMSTVQKAVKVARTKYFQWPLQNIVIGPKFYGNTLLDLTPSYP